MSTDAISASALRTLEEYQTNASSSATSSTGINADDFLKLFIAQLSNQDPLSSSSDSSGTDYISQLAQLTMLQQLSSLSNSISTSQAYSMIGKYVYIGDGSGSSLIFGKVDGVIYSDGTYELMVAGETYDLSEIYAVIGDDAISSATDDEVLASANLIGKTVTAEITETDDGGNATASTVTGKVDKILVQDGAIYLVIGEQNIALSNVTEIAETAEETTAD